MKFLLTQACILMTFWMVMYFIKFKKMSKMKSLSPFECGYNSMSSKLPMSIQFTLLVFMFLLFDIELSVLISSNWNSINMTKSWITTMLIFFALMLLSILYEMKKKSFKWN